MRNCTDLWISRAWGFLVTVATLRGPNRSEKEEAGRQFSSWDEGSHLNIAKIVKIEQEASKCSVWQEKKPAFCSKMISHLLSLHAVTMLPRKGCTRAKRTYIICTMWFFDIYSQSFKLNSWILSWVISRLGNFLTQAYLLNILLVMSVCILHFCISLWVMHWLPGTVTELHDSLYGFILQSGETRGW